MSLTPEEHDYIGQVIAEDEQARRPRKRSCDQCLTCKGTGIEHDGAAHPCTDCDGRPVPPAGDVEVLGWALNDGDEHPIDITLQWGVAKHWPEYATPLVDRAHVTRLTAERDGLLAEVASLQALVETHAQVVRDQEQLIQLKRVENEALTIQSNDLRAVVQRLNAARRRIRPDGSGGVVDKSAVVVVAELQSELTKAREALAGMVEYFPEGHSDGECFSVERAKAVLAHQSAPAAKLIERGTTHGFEQSANTCRHDDKSGVWWREGNVTRTGRECNACGHVVEDAPAAKGG